MQHRMYAVQKRHEYAPQHIVARGWDRGGCLRLNLPVSKGVGLRVEVDAGFHYGQAAEGEAGGVVLEVDLPHGGLGGTVELQLEEIQLLRRAQHHVHTTRGGAHLHVDVTAQQGEDDVEQLLVMSFVVRVVALGDGQQVGLEQAQHTVEVVLAQRHVHLGHGGVALVRVHLHVVGQQALHEADADFGVGDVEHVELAYFIVVLDGEVAALVEQRDDGLHVLRGRVEVRCHSRCPSEHGGHDVELAQHFDEEGRRTALEPVVPQRPVLQGIEQAEGVEDVGRPGREMVAVVSCLQRLQRLFRRHLFLFGKALHVVRHLLLHLLHADAADGGEIRFQGDVLQVVQLAEYAELGELRDAGEEDEVEVRVGVLQRRIEVAHHVAELGQVLILVHHVEQRRVVFVDEHDHFLARLFVNAFDEVGQADVGVGMVGKEAEAPLVLAQDVAQVVLELFFFHVLGRCHAEMQYGVFRPFLFLLFYIKSFEEFLPALEIALEHGHQQRLAEPARAAQEDVLAQGGHFVDVHGLVNVQTMQVDDFRECLDAYGQPFECLAFHIECFLFSDCRDNPFLVFAIKK